MGGVEGSHAAIERSQLGDRIVRANLERGVPNLGRFDLWHMLYSPFDVFLMGLVAALAAAVAWKRMRHLYPRPVALPSQRRSAL